MKDINFILRKAYTAALAGIGVGVYYQNAPPNYTDNYIVFRGINSNDVSTKNSSDTSTIITVEIHTFNNGVNNGLSADDLAAAVYQRIYPNVQFNLSLDGAQIVTTRIASDITNNVVIQSNRTYISRFITFRHNIFVDSDNLS